MCGIRRALALCASLALLPSLATADDPYADYRIPEHYWRSWTANVSAGGDHLLFNGSESGQSRSGSLNGTLTTSLSGGYDSDPRSSAYGLGLTARGGGTRATEHDEQPLSTFDETHRLQGASEEISGFFAFSRFPWSTPIGLTVSSNQVVNLSQAWESFDRSNVAPPVESRTSSNLTQGIWDVFVALSASLEWGRVRDATPVYQVQVLEQRLLDEGTIQRPLSPGARERLAALYTTENRLAFAHQRPTKYFWGELERLLQEDGVLSEGGLNAYSVQRLLEPLTIAGAKIARTRGFSVGPQVTMWMDQSQRSSAFNSSSAFYQNGTLVSASQSTSPRIERFDRFDSIFSGMAVEYHRPFGPRWQVDGLSSVLLSESGKTLLSATVLRGAFLVSDRWFADARVDHDQSAPGSGWDRHSAQWDVTCRASVNYFIEDSWSLGASAVQRQSRGPNGYDRRETFTLGVTWQLAGFLNAPGLFEPMRLTSPAR